MAKNSMLGRLRAKLAGGRRRLVYRLRLGGPDPGASDDVLADRVRSMLGPLEKRLDLPRLHVMVADGAAMLHGVVASEADATRLVEAAAAVPGIRAIDPRLTIGLRPGDTRPSTGRRHVPPSAAVQRLTGAARAAAGLEAGRAELVVSAVVTTLAERLPPREREHFVRHLPADLQPMASRPRSPAKVGSRIRTAKEFAESVRSLAGLDHDAPLIREVVASRAILGELRALVPEEADDVAAVLPAEIRELWKETS